MFWQERRIKNLEDELNGWKQKFYNLSWEVSLIRDYLGVTMQSFPPKTILVENEKAKK